jgi:hypothetical protein
MAVAYFVLFLAYIKTYFLIYFNTITHFILFQLLAVSYYVMLEKKMKFETDLQ